MTITFFVFTKKRCAKKERLIMASENEKREKDRLVDNYKLGRNSGMTALEAFGFARRSRWIDQQIESVKRSIEE